MAKEIAGQAGHADKPKGGPGCKRSGNGMKVSGMACSGSNSWDLKPPL